MPGINPKDYYEFCKWQIRRNKWALYEFFHGKHYRKNGHRLKFRTVNKRLNRMIKARDRAMIIEKINYRWKAGQ